MGKKAGKGALIQEEISATLGVSQDQILFQAVQGFDSYSLNLTGEIGRTLATPSGGLNEHIPIVIENHPNDSRVDINESGKVQTLTSRCGTGGGQCATRHVQQSQESKVRR